VEGSFCICLISISMYKLLTHDVIEETINVSLEKRIDDFALMVHKRLADQTGEAEDAGLLDLR